MKNLEEIKKEVAVKHGYADWLDLMTQYKLELKISYSRLNLYIDEVAEEHAKQCCDEQIKLCAENAEANLQVSGMSQFAEVDKESILNTPNVVTTK